MTDILSNALQNRSANLDDAHVSACRLFNGPVEGNPELVVDVYGKTLLLHDYRAEPSEESAALEEAKAFYLEALPWIEAVVLKQRHGATDEARWGRLVFGEKPTKRIVENGVHYSVDLLMNQDAGLYLDTRNLRQWVIDNLEGKSVLNTFAYTGSLGVAARGGKAKSVVHTDLSRRFLNVAKTSYSLNGFSIDKKDFVTGDFFQVVKKLTRAGRQFDCVFLDPPFFSSHKRADFKTETDAIRLINKVRPLVRHGGIIAAVNNALFVSGADYMKSLEAICEDGYVEILEMIPVPDDFIPAGAQFPTDPAPFNHPTKIALLKITKKGH